MTHFVTFHRKERLELQSVIEAAINQFNASASALPRNCVKTPLKELRSQSSKFHNS